MNEIVLTIVVITLVVIGSALMILFRIVFPAAIIAEFLKGHKRK